MPRNGVKKFPKAAITPEFVPRKWDRSSICIGAKPGELDVNFCLNTMCKNFGLTAKQAKSRGVAYAYSVRKKNKTLTLICPECGQSRRLYSNVAVDKMFQQLLESHSLHEYCTNPDCENYRVNLYENYPDRYYRAEGAVPTDPEKLKAYKYKIRCKKCPKRPPIGPAWGLHSDFDVELFMKLVINGVGPSSMIDIFDFYEGRYYPRLHALARACNFMSAKHLMELQQKKFAKNIDCMRLYSDIMDISLFMEIKKRRKRTAALNVLITSTDYGDSFFILALTPMFVPGAIDGEREAELAPEALLLESEQPHAHMLWGGTPIDYSAPPKSQSATYPVEGLDGCLVRSSYGAIAHFLVLRKMLSRVNRIVHYVDNEDELQSGALTAFADRIEEGRCDVISVGIEQAMKGDKAMSQYKKDVAQMDADETAPAERQQYRR